MVEMVESGETQELEPPQALETKLITLEILKLIKDAQQTHGLRHGDYQRYRSYCSRRLRRLRKVLKVPQGDRRHFKKRDISEAHLNLPNADERYLHIPLVLAERAWAYAMQLRQEANSEIRKRFHLISKLRKACSHAIQLETLCNLEKCDARTKLEAQAYTAWMQGTLQFELQLWDKAAENLKKAQVVYGTLAAALPDDEQAPYHQRLDELAPSLRYCAYNIGEELGGDVLQLRSPGLLEHLDTLALQARARRAGELLEVAWQGLKVIVRPDKCRLFLLGIRPLDAALAQAEGAQARVALLEEMLIDCRDAIAVARDEVRANATGSQLLLTYLLHVRLTRTVQRNQYLIEQARKPQDSVRLYDIILQQMSELKELSGLEENKPYQEDIANQTTLFRAFRTYHLAKANTVAKRWREALIVYKSSLKLINTVISCNAAKEIKEKATKLRKDIQSEVYVAQAHCVIEDTEEKTELPTKNAPKIKTPLLERLDEYREDTGVSNKSAKIVNMPAMEPVPNKPLFFDLASNFIQFPDLSDKLDAPQNKPKQSAGMSGFVKGLFGWGGK